MKLNAPLHALKAYYQESVARGSLCYYTIKANRNGRPLKEADITSALHRKVQDRVQAPKKKGELNIFIAASINNWEAILPEVLASFGTVTVFDWKQGGYYDNYEQWTKGRKGINERMLAAFNDANAKKKIDVVVGYLSSFNTQADTLAHMASAGAVIFNFCWDDKLIFSGTVKGQDVGPGRLAQVIDLNLTNAPVSCVKYQANGGLAMFWPEAAHPALHRPYESEFDIDISFVGRKYGWRAEFIERLKQNGVNVVAFGSGWDNGVLSDTEMIRLYSRSRINLGFSGVGYSKKLLCLKGRDFEIPMSGGLYLTQDNPELSNVYEVGKEIVVYKDYAHCLKQIRWLLDNPEKAQEIRRAGLIRALKDHTWDKRFTQIFCMSGILEEAVQDEK